MSEFKFACPVCGQHMKCDASHGGAVMQCPTCFQKITAPQAPAADSKFILTGTQVSEKKISARGYDPATGAATPKKNSPLVIAMILAVVLAAAGAAILFKFPRAPLKPGATGHGAGNPVVVESSREREATPAGAAGLGTWGTEVEFSDFVVTKGSQVLFKSDFPAGLAGWRIGNGAWTAQNGVLRQGSLAQDCRALAGESGWGDYTISVRARKLSGKEGFLIIFNATDNDNWTWWNIGGWGNTKHAIEHCVSGKKSTLGNTVAGQIKSGTWYDLRVELSGSHILCYLNNSLIHDAVYPASNSSLSQ
jgi:hypothetical protein